MANDLELAKSRGVTIEGARAFMPYTTGANGQIRVDWGKARAMAQDSARQTLAGVGVPSALLTLVDPQIIEILFAATNATKIAEEQRKGDWTKDSYLFGIEETVGAVTPYTDFSDNVTTDVNHEFVRRENFVFQTVLRAGDREVAVASQAGIEYVSSKQKAVATILAQAHNRFYLYGVKGLQSYGLLNDPNLPASETPISTTDSKSTWEDKMAAHPAEISNLVYNDVNKLFTSLAAKAGSHVDMSTRMILAVSNKRMSYLSASNQYNVTAADMIKKNFPNLEIVTLPELSTATGEMLFLIVPELYGTKTAVCAYSEKMRMFAPIRQTSSTIQKAVGGTWGCVIARPFLIATMTGV